jgi:hypothetical protein
MEAVDFLTASFFGTFSKHIQHPGISFFRLIALIIRKIAIFGICSEFY